MIPYGRQDIFASDIDAVVKVLRSDFLTQDPAVPAFENAVARYCGVGHALAVNSATSAMHIEPADLRDLCRRARTAWEALGSVNYERKSSELGNVKFRRSLYFVKPLRAGERETADAVRSVRPGYGLAPKYLDQVIGKTVLRDVGAHTPANADAVGPLA